MLGLHFMTFFGYMCSILSTFWFLHLGLAAGYMIFTFARLRLFMTFALIIVKIAFLNYY
jgi:hypothetical protein